MNVKYDKESGLIPAIIQDANTKTVLMLGYMNSEAFAKTQKDGKVTFWSRSRQCLWTKGETSGNFLNVVDIKIDCDSDTLLIKVNPAGPVCHTNSDTCFGEANTYSTDFLKNLEQTISERQINPTEKSYTSMLFDKGINKIAQKVGEEAVELVIEAKDNNADLFKGEAADLLFHYLVLLRAKGFKLSDVVDVLETRHK